ncbi:MAG: hypothetical protein IT285_01640 [Bdellovibrionales bacterium]|nr:hypothetical protein [Bdellovibrionales bacterium]
MNRAHFRRQGISTFQLGLIASGVITAVLAGSLSFGPEGAPKGSEWRGPAATSTFAPGSLLQEALTLAQFHRDQELTATRQDSRDQLFATARALTRTALWVEKRGALQGRNTEAGHARNLLLNARDKILMAAGALGSPAPQALPMADARRVDHAIAQFALPLDAAQQPRALRGIANEDRSPPQPQMTDSGTRDELMVDHVVRWMTRPGQEANPTGGMLRTF